MISRRKFLQISGLASAGIMLPNRLLGETCDRTTTDLMGLGPYWEPDTPYRTQLASIDEPGARLTLRGRVTADDCKTPIPNVVIDAWQANDEGCYSVSQICTTGNPDNDHLNLRGRVLSNLEGQYLIETIKPGFYYLGNNLYRPSHIHFMITPPAGDSLVTQLYFEGDDYLDGDTGSSDPNAVDRIIPLYETETGFEGTFNVILNIDSSQRAINTNIPTSDDIVRIKNISTYPNPFNSRVKIRFDMPKSGHAIVSVYDVKGRWIQTLKDGNIDRGEHILMWDGKRSNGLPIPAGEYFLSVQSLFDHQIQKILYLK